MKKQILLALFFTFTYFGLHAQCNEPFPPAQTCDGAPIICSLDGYCTQSPTSPNAQDQPSTFCGSVQNNQWFSFVAGTDAITLDFIITTCNGTTQGTGLQAQVYSACGNGWPSASNCLYQIFPNSTSQLIMTGLTIGNIYYLMTDGFSGDVCNYTIEVASGSTTPPTPDDAGTIAGDLNPCIGANSVTYTLPPSFGAGFYNWVLPAGATIIGADDQNTITIDWGSSAGGQLCVTPSNGCEDGGQSCVTITPGANPTDYVAHTMCVNEMYTYGNTTYSYAVAGPYSEFNQDVTNSSGCTIDASLDFTIGATAMTPLTEFICQGDMSTTGETVEGFYTYSLLTSLNCDSTVTLDLTVMDPIAGIQVPGVLDCGLNLTTTLQAIVTDVSPTISYTWSGPCMLGVNGGPTMLVGCAGDYSLVVSDTQGGTTCFSAPFQTTVNSNTALPVADPGTLAAIDCTNSSVTLGGPNTSMGSQFAYSWTGPGGYTDITPDPSVSIPGQYCLFVVNTTTFCQSTTECITVTGDNTLPVAMASNTNPTLDCNNSNSTLESTGSESGPNITYTWAGQSGSNPSVNTPGTYTLTVTNTATGCSATATTIVGQDNSTPTVNIAMPTPLDCINTNTTLDGSGSTGTGTLTYMWTGGTSGPTLSVGTANTYTLTVTQANGCTASATVNVADNSAPVSATVDVQGQITCTNGSVTATAMTGASNPTYVWTLDGTPIGSNSPTVTVNGPGTVGVTVIDGSNGCSSPEVTEVVIEDSNVPTAVASASGNIDCANPSVVLNTAGSSTGGSINATWTLNGSPVSDPNNISTPGTYVLTINNTANGCSDTDQIIVDENTAAPNVTLNQPAAIDCDNQITTIDASGSTGIGNLSYTWTGNVTGSGASVTANGAGPVSVTILDDANGCTTTEQLTIVDNTTNVQVTASASDVLDCQTPSINLEAGNVMGASNPTYTWTDASNTTVGNSATVPTGIAGTYTVTVEDPSTGCQGTASVVVQEDANLPTASVADPSDLTCDVSQVTIDGSASAQGNNISYQWQLNGVDVPSGNSTLLPVATAGSYVLVVTNTDNGCSTESIPVNVVLDDAEPVVNLAAGNNGVISCSTAFLTVDGSGSTGTGITYEWSIDGSPSGGNTPTLDVFSAGTVSLTVTNSGNGCSATESIIISPDADVPAINVDPFLNLDCNNSMTTLLGTGASNSGGSVTLQWVDPNTGTILSNDGNFSTTDPGTFVFEVIDNGNGCSQSQSITVGQNTAAPISDAGVIQTIDCDNDMVTLNGSNSSQGADITYQWINPAGVPTGGNSSTLTTSMAGQWTLVVTDGTNGCDATSFVNVDENIVAPEITADVLNQIDCNNTDASLEGGVTSSFSNDLSYEWSFNGAVINSDPTNPNVSVNNPGDYDLVVTDNQNGCTAIISVPVVEDAIPPAIAAVASNNGILNCFDGDLELDGTGSTDVGNITYSWELVGAGVVSNDLVYTTSDAGQYIFTVLNTDNGCSSTMNLTVDLDDVAPNATASASTSTLTCTNPAATLDGSSSSIGADFSYQWFDVTTGTPSLISNDINFNVGVAGTYELVVTNNVNGCAQTSTQVVIDQSADVPVAVITDNGEIDCDQSEVILDGSSSTAGGTLSYEWVDVASGTILGNGETITVLTPGAVELNIIDQNNGCTSTDAFTVVEDIAAAAVDAGQNFTINCDNPEYTLDGSASVLEPGTNYSFSWTVDGNPTSFTDLVVPNVTLAGTYELTITNMDNGCIEAATVNLADDFTPPVADSGNGSTITCGDLNATLDGSASDAGSSYTYSWVDQTGAEVAATMNASTALPGTYTLVVTNTDNGCTSASLPVQVDIDADLPALSLAPAPTITCMNNSEVTLDGSASDAGADIEYEWFLGATSMGNSAFLTTNQTGTYTFVVTNNTTGCVSQENIDVADDIVAPDANPGNGGTLICGQASFTLDGTGSINPAFVNYAWWTYDEVTGLPINQVGDDITFDAGAAGNYVLISTNTVNGCSSVSASVEIIQDANSPTIDIAPTVNLTCDLQTITVDGSASAASAMSGGSLIYTWTDAIGTPLGSTPTIDVSDPGEVILTITDDVNNCTATTSAIVVQDVEAPIANAGANGTLLCDNNPVTLDGGGSSAGGAAFTYSWQDAAGFEVSNQQSFDAMLAGNYTLVITNTVNGCSSESVAIVDTDTNIPTAVVSFNGMLDCNVDAIMVDGSNSSTANGGAFEYQWSTGSTNPTENFDTPGTYTLTITDLTNNCDNFTEFTIDQDIAPPMAEISSIGNVISCTAPSLVFNGSNSAGSNGSALTYEWILNGVSIPGGITDEIEITDDGTLELVVTNVSNGCTAMTSASITTDESVPNAVIANPNTLTCLETEVTLNGNGSSTGTEYEYLWSGPGAIVDETTLTPSVNAPGTYVLTITNTDNGCVETEQIIVGQQVDPPTAVANANDQFNCITEEITLDGNGSSTGSNFTYQWTTSSGTFVSGANTFNPTISAPGNYTLIVTNTDNGCTSEALVNATADNDVPVIADYQVNDPNCFGENNGSIILDGVVGGQLPYLFSINESAFAPINQFSFLPSGEYNIVVQDANGCESMENIIVTDPPLLQVELGDDITIGLGETADLNPQILGAYDSLYWTNCMAEECDQADITFTPFNTSDYSITLIDGNGCVTTDDITVIVEKGREVFIPNVFTPGGGDENDYFWIYAGIEVLKVHEFRVFNRWGEEVFEKVNFDPRMGSESDGWDGRFNNKMMNPAVFVYYVDIEYIDGRREILKGDVTLRR